MAPFQFDKATWLLKCHVYGSAGAFSHSAGRKLELGDTRDLSDPVETGDFEFARREGEKRGEGGRNEAKPPERRIDRRARLVASPRPCDASHYQSMTYECMYRETFYAKINSEGEKQSDRVIYSRLHPPFSDLRAKIYTREREFFTATLRCARAREPSFFVTIYRCEEKKKLGAKTKGVMFLN